MFLGELKKARMSKIRDYDVPKSKFSFDEFIFMCMVEVRYRAMMVNKNFIKMLNQ